MVAVYPAGIKTFAYRTDYTDLVEAADVNTAYDEIRAVQNTLGVNPAQETIDGKLKTYTNVSTRISQVRKGLDNPYCGVQAHDVSVSFNQDYQVAWKNKLMDTHGMWDGSQYLTCPRTGIYQFDFYVRWHKDSTLVADSSLATFDRSGKLQIEGVQVGSSGFLTCQTDWYPQGFHDFARQSCSMIYPWYQGNKVGTRLYQSTYRAGTLWATTYINIAYLRDIS
jgi:hypothetical protein